MSWYLIEKLEWLLLIDLEGSGSLRKGIQFNHLRRGECLKFWEHCLINLYFEVSMFRSGVSAEGDGVGHVKVITLLEAVRALLDSGEDVNQV